MAATESALLDALKAVTDPNTGRDFVSGRQVKNLHIDGTGVSFDVELGYPAKSQIPALRKALTDALQSPEFRKKLEATGSGVASPTVDTDKYIASEIDKYRKIVQFAKIEE